MWTTEVLPRLLDITEAEIEEGEMLNRGMHGRHGDLWKEKAAIAAGIVLMLMMLLLSFAWGSGCNGDGSILVACSRVSLRAEPCGNNPEAPESWEITIDHRQQLTVPNMAIIGEEGMWIPLGDYYRLHPGDNLIEYRAVRAGYVAGPTESVVLSLGTEIPPPEMGAYTITEVIGEGN